MAQQFGYTGGAGLPIYDEIFSKGEVEHIRVRPKRGPRGAAGKRRGLCEPPAGPGVGCDVGGGATTW